MMYWKIDRANIIGLAVFVAVLTAILFAVLNPPEEHESPEPSVSTIMAGPPRETPGLVSEAENDDQEAVKQVYAEFAVTSYEGPYVTDADVENIAERNEVLNSNVLVPEDETMEQPHLEYLGTYSIVGYDTCVACCGKSDGITASGTVATVGRTVATGCGEFPFGTILWIPGIGERVVEDVGNLKPGMIDVLCENHASCYAITGRYDVYRIVEPRGADRGQAD